jgi:hypothetical protein
MFDVARCAHLPLRGYSTSSIGAIRSVDVVSQEVLPIDTVYHVNRRHPQPAFSLSIEHFLSLVSFHSWQVLCTCEPKHLQRNASKVTHPVRLSLQKEDRWRVHGLLLASHTDSRCESKQPKHDTE